MHLQPCRRPKRAMLNTGNCASLCASLHAHNVTFTEHCLSYLFIVCVYRICCDSPIMSDIFRVSLQRNDEESNVKEESVKDSNTV